MIDNGGANEWGNRWGSLKFKYGDVVEITTIPFFDEVKGRIINFREREYDFTERKVRFAYMVEIHGQIIEFEENRLRHCNALGVNPKEEG